MGVTLNLINVNPLVAMATTGVPLQVADLSEFEVPQTSDAEQLSRVVSGKTDPGIIPHVMPPQPLTEEGWLQAPLPPRIMEASGFWRTQAAKVQIEDGKKKFLEMARETGVATDAAGTLARLLENTRCIDTVTFGLALLNMRKALIEFLGDSPYVVCKFYARSEKFILDCMLRLGLPRAPYKIGTPCDMLVEPSKYVKYVIIDDAAFTGSTVKELLRRLKNERVPRESVFVGLIASTDIVRYFMQEASRVYCGVRIPRNDDGEKFSKGDVTLLRWFGAKGVVKVEAPKDLEGEVEQLIPVHAKLPSKDCDAFGSTAFMFYKYPDTTCSALHLSGILSPLDNGNPDILPRYDELAVRFGAVRTSKFEGLDLVCCFLRSRIGEPAERHLRRMLAKGKYSVSSADLMWLEHSLGVRFCIKNKRYMYQCIYYKNGNVKLIPYAKRRGKRYVKISKQEAAKLTETLSWR